MNLARKQSMSSYSRSEVSLCPMNATSVELKTSKDRFSIRPGGDMIFLSKIRMSLLSGTAVLLLRLFLRSLMKPSRSLNLSGRHNGISRLTISSTLDGRSGYSNGFPACFSFGALYIYSLHGETNSSLYIFF